MEHTPTNHIFTLHLSFHRIMGCDKLTPVLSNRKSKYPLGGVAPLQSGHITSALIRPSCSFKDGNSVFGSLRVQRSFFFSPCPRIDLDLEAGPFDSLESLIRRRAAAAEVGGRRRRRRARLSSSAKTVNLRLEAVRNDVVSSGSVNAPTFSQTKNIGILMEQSQQESPGVRQNGKNFQLKWLK